MVTLLPKTYSPKVHSLIANKDISSMNKGDMKNCLIIEMTDKRYAVFSLAYENYFYVVLKSVKELHSTFNEQLQLNEE